MYHDIPLAYLDAKLRYKWTAKKTCKLKFRNAIYIHKKEEKRNVNFHTLCVYWVVSRLASRLLAINFKFNEHCLVATQQRLCITYVFALFLFVNAFFWNCVWNCNLQQVYILILIILSHNEYASGSEVDSYVHNALMNIRTYYFRLTPNWDTKNAMLGSSISVNRPFKFTVKL